VRERKEALRRKQERAVRLAKEHGVPTRKTLLVMGHAAQLIVHAVEEEQADLLALGRRVGTPRCGGASWAAPPKRLPVMRLACERMAICADVKSSLSDPQGGFSGSHHSQIRRLRLCPTHNYRHPVQHLGAFRCRLEG
jgi:hypothetical protein